MTVANFVPLGDLVRFSRWRNNDRQDEWETGGYIFSAKDALAFQAWSAAYLLEHYGQECERPTVEAWLDSNPGGAYKHESNPSREQSVTFNGRGYETGSRNQIDTAADRRRRRGF